MIRDQPGLSVASVKKFEMYFMKIIKYFTAENVI